MTTETMRRDETNWFDLSDVQLKEKPSTSASVFSRFSRDAIEYHREPGKRRHLLRASLVSRILRHRQDKSVVINAVLDALLGSPLAGRLDDAIDLLADLGGALEDFASELAFKRVADDDDDDRWYIVIHALGRSGKPTARNVVQAFAAWCPDAADEVMAEFTS